jgi:tetratricopeptide (TPR) repeat protein
VTFEQKLEAAQRAHRAGDAENAMRQYFEAFRLDPADTRAHAGIAYLQLSRQPERAEEVLLKVIDANPNATMAYVGVGLAKLAQDDPDAAASYLEQAIALDPSSANAHDAYAVVLERCSCSRPQTHAPRERPRRQLRDRQQLRHHDLLAATQRPSARSTTQRRSNARVPLPQQSRIAVGRQGRYAEALTQFRLAGTEQAAENNLGYVYFLNGDHGQAIAHFERASNRGRRPRQILRNSTAARREGRRKRLNAAARRCTSSSARQVEALGYPPPRASCSCSVCRPQHSTAQGIANQRPLSAQNLSAKSTKLEVSTLGNPSIASLAK